MKRLYRTFRNNFKKLYRRLLQYITCRMPPSVKVSLHATITNPLHGTNSLGIDELLRNIDTRPAYSIHLKISDGGPPDVIVHALNLICNDGNLAGHGNIPLRKFVLKQAAEQANFVSSVRPWLSLNQQA